MENNRKQSRGSHRGQKGGEPGMVRVVSYDGSDDLVMTSAQLLRVIQQMS